MKAWSKIVGILAAKQWRICAGSGCQGGTQRVWDHNQSDFSLCGRVAIMSDAAAVIGMVHRLGWGKVGDVRAGEDSSLQNVRVGESGRCTNEVPLARTIVASRESV